MCIMNQASEDQTFEFYIKAGELSDARSQAITKQHLRPVEA